MNKTVLTLETITCPTCIVKIEDALNRMEGIEELKFLFQASKIRAIFNQHLVTAEEIAAAIKKSGFEVRHYKTAILE